MLSGMEVSFIQVSWLPTDCAHHSHLHPRHILSTQESWSNATLNKLLRRERQPEWCARDAWPRNAHEQHILG